MSSHRKYLNELNNVCNALQATFTCKQSKTTYKLTHNLKFIHGLCCHNNVLIIILLTQHFVLLGAQKTIIQIGLQNITLPYLF